jgi:cell division protein FtsQ
MMGFVSNTSNNVICEKINVRIENVGSNFFVSEDEIVLTVSENGFRTVGQKMEDINIMQIEEVIAQKNPFIKNVDVYKTIDGTVNIDIEERLPIVRVFTRDYKSFYIDEDGYLMPPSKNYAARVTIANGNISFSAHKMILNNKIHIDSEILGEQGSMLREIYKVAKFTSEDEFWNAQIQQLFVDNYSDIILIPRVGLHKIVLGNSDELEEKLDKLLYFYKNGLSKAGWNKYETINLKYNNQVVCTKKSN